MPNDADPLASTRGAESLEDPALASTAAGSTRPPTIPPSVGRVIENRYTLVRLLGRGAFGEVWEAEDRIVGESVAFKWLLTPSGPMVPRVRREITTLRILRFPGVVRLLDDGVADDKPFLVMELVAGKPFPGRAGEGPRTWASLAGPTLGLLETLSHVHAAGVIHRDLKPDNVLVRPDGRPIVLDFGISLLHTHTTHAPPRGHPIAGSPLYMAPEQISSTEIDARTDLYALGLMLYEALTGQVPHHSTQLMTLFRNRVTMPVRPVQELVPTLPKDVAKVINRLLETRAEDRFDTAADVLAALRGEAMTITTLPTFLGPRARLIEMAQNLERGQSIDLVGAHGSGRTRWLCEIASLLESHKRDVQWLRPSGTALGSLIPILGEPHGAHDVRLEEAMAWAEEALSRQLAAGTILLVDNAEEVDEWSAAVLARCRAKPGAMLRASLTVPPNIPPHEIVHIPLLDEVALRPLFAGPDRLLHLREDAARALWDRTNGHPGQIELELHSWTRMGLARRDGQVLFVDREALGRLQTGLVGVRMAKLPDVDVALHDDLAENALRWLSLAGCPLSVAQLASLLQCASFRVEAACQNLLRRDLLKTNDGHRYEIRWRVHVLHDEQQRIHAHRAIAYVLSPGDDMRLYHLLAAGLSLEAAHEAVDVATRHLTNGHVSTAIALLAEGLRAARDEHGVAEEKSILITWAKAGLADGTVRAMDRVLYEMARLRVPDADLRRIEVLLRAAILAPRAGGMQALEMVEGLGAFADPELERWRHHIRVTAVAVSTEASLIADVLCDVEDWADETDEPLAHLSLAEGRARQRYHEGHFEDAVQLYTKAAALESTTPGRVATLLRGASALLEAFRHDEATRIAEEARQVAAEFRNPVWEGRAEWIIRSAQYRTGKTKGADMELVDAVARVDAEEVEALVCLNEAAAAMRANQRAYARKLAERAATIWRGMGRPYATMLARTLAIACGATTNQDEMQVLATRALECKGPGIGIQTLGILGMIVPELRATWQNKVDELVKEIPRAHWKERMDVLSVDEAWEGATGGRAKDPLPS